MIHKIVTTQMRKKYIYIHIKRKLLASEHPCACTGGQPWASVGTPACLHHLLSLLLLLLRQHKHNTDKNRTTIKEKKMYKKIKTFNHSWHDGTPHQTYQTRQSRRPPLQTRAGDGNSF